MLKKIKKSSSSNNFIHGNTKHSSLAPGKKTILNPASSEKPVFTDTPLTQATTHDKLWSQAHLKVIGMV